MRPQTGNSSFLGKLALTAAFAGMLSLGATPRAFADQYERCQRRIANADHHLHEAIEHHGRNSSEADHWRHELHEARERCWNQYHRWWDEDQRRWHTDRDWDDHDHDRD